ncbi:iron-sulfur cluster co-chaperone protein HscB [Salarias fasciatus]|uniref:Iron-sulfur cluster co-chaperone protein HscB n=1 Tax=Salarias fasciatus TaxID=181472 RepID=A0A672IIA3_SALFA|nr:iron-sulfur cluster co-chaperone protein HscB [Salarias fasciatus]
MLSATCLRSLYSPRLAVLPLRLKTSLQSVCEAAPCRALCRTVSSNINKDTWHSKFSAPGFKPQLFDHIGGLCPIRRCSTSHVKQNCWNCQQVLDRTPAFFCMACKVVQPPDEGTSYFKIMDCDHTFTLDTQKLQRRYLQLQRSLHPDNFSQKSAKEQEYSESQSALVNKAYTTLLKPLSRGLYMLELAGMHIDEGTDSGAQTDFLMELMEINEALDEARTPAEAERIGQDMKGKLVDLTKQIDAALCEGELQTAKALLAQMKYYANIEEKVKEKLTEFM